MATDQCLLCGEQRNLQRSHVLPKFATNWIKKTSGKPGHKRLRGYGDAIAQDGLKFPMFCSDCEQLLGRDETEFSRRAFGDSYLLSSERVPYGEWMLRFAVGLMLRVCSFELYFSDPALSVRPLTQRETRAIGNACEDFRQYLQGSTVWPGKFMPLRLSFDFTSLPADRVIRSHLDHYMARGVDSTLAIGGGQLAVYAHIPFHVFWTQVIPKGVKENEWRNCRIRKSGFIDPSQDQHAPAYFWEFLESRLEVTEDTFSTALKRTVEFVEAKDQ